jgi:hypothetical protein
MMRTTLYLLSWLITLSIALPEASARDKKGDEKDPDWIEFSVLRDGEQSGTFGFKTVTAKASGNIFTTSKLEMKTKRGTLGIMTHVELHPSGKLIKYRKWVGNEGASPDLVAFWMDATLRIVSKIPKHRFKRDVTPGDGFVPLDGLGFHLYGHLAGLWKQSQPQSVPCVRLHKGKTDTLTMQSTGTAILKNKAGKEVVAEAVHVKAKGFNLVLFVGDKPTYLGFKSKKVLLVRNGWNLVSLKEGEHGKQEVKVEETGKEEKPLENETPVEKKEEVKGEKKEERPPLPE